MEFEPIIDRPSTAKISLNDDGISFEVTLLEPKDPSHIALFSVGSGGNPERHLPLLIKLSEAGCVVVAPHFDRLASAMPTEKDLLLRARRLLLAMKQVMHFDLPVIGIGHSIGATLVLALSGGQLWMGPGLQLPILRDEAIKGLVLMTPATGFFRAPKALDNVRVPILIWAGSNDLITPPAEAEFLRQNLENRAPVKLQVIEGAGHFSFMDILPPQVTDPIANREVFLARLAGDITHFIQTEIAHPMR